MPGLGEVCVRAGQSCLPGFLAPYSFYIPLLPGIKFPYLGDDGATCMVSDKDVCLASALHGFRSQFSYRLIPTSGHKQRLFRPWKGLAVFLLPWYLCFLRDVLCVLDCLLE